MAWTRNLLVFESFASSPQGTFLKGFASWLASFDHFVAARVFLLETSFLGRSIGNVRAVFAAVVLNGLDTKPAGVRGFHVFRKSPQGTFLKGFGWWLLLD